MLGPVGDFVVVGVFLRFGVPCVRFRLFDL